MNEAPMFVVLLSYRTLLPTKCFRRIVVDSKLSLVAAMKANTVVDCPRFIARSKDGSEDAPRNVRFAIVDYFLCFKKID